MHRGLDLVYFEKISFARHGNGHHPFSSKFSTRFLCRFRGQANDCGIPAAGMSMAALAFFQIQVHEVLEVYLRTKQNQRTRSPLPCFIEDHLRISKIRSFEHVHCTVHSRFCSSSRCLCIDASIASKPKLCQEAEPCNHDVPCMKSQDCLQLPQNFSGSATNLPILDET